MINGQIRDKEIRVIGENGDQLGIMSPKEAMKLAQEADLDLVKIAPKAQPREMAHVQQSKHILDDFAQMLGDIAVIEKPAKMEGRSMSMVLTEKR